MKLIIVLIFGMWVSSCSSLKNREINKVKEVVIKMVNAIDTKKWKVAASQFENEVFVDYESLTGKPGSKILSNGLVGNWKALLKKVDTHHMLTNFEVKIDGDRAEIYSHVYASHQAKGIKYWDAYGRYHHKLKKTKNGWKITFMKLIMHGQKGNKLFLQQASKL